MTQHTQTHTYTSTCERVQTHTHARAHSHTHGFKILLCCHSLHGGGAVPAPVIPPACSSLAPADRQLAEQRVEYVQGGNYTEPPIGTAAHGRI